MQDDLISRQAIQTELKNCEVVDVRDENDNLVGYYNADTVDSIVRNLPPVTPQQKYGKWIAVYQGDEIINYCCSECELGDTNGSTNLHGWDYCRRCGAKMFEPQESEDKE